MHIHKGAPLRIILQFWIKDYFFTIGHSSTHSSRVHIQVLFLHYFIIKKGHFFIQSWNYWRAHSPCSLGNYILRSLWMSLLEEKFTHLLMNLIDHTTILRSQLRGVLLRGVIYYYLSSCILEGALCGFFYVDICEQYAMSENIIPYLACKHLGRCTRYGHLILFSSQKYYIY